MVKFLMMKNNDLIIMESDAFSPLKSILLAASKTFKVLRPFLIDLYLRYSSFDLTNRSHRSK